MAPNLHQIHPVTGKCAACPDLVAQERDLWVASTYQWQEVWIVFDALTMLR
jgi:hypothetical protein